VSDIQDLFVYENVDIASALRKAALNVNAEFAPSSGTRAAGAGLAGVATHTINAAGSARACIRAALACSIAVDATGAFKTRRPVDAGVGSWAGDTDHTARSARGVRVSPDAAIVDDATGALTAASGRADTVVAIFASDAGLACGPAGPAVGAGIAWLAGIRAVATFASASRARISSWVISASVASSGSVTNSKGVVVVPEIEDRSEAPRHGHDECCK
jgi:hypothetical protein